MTETFTDEPGKPNQRPSWHRRPGNRFLAAAGLAALSVASIQGCKAHANAEVESAAPEAVAGVLALERNTCTIDSMAPVVKQSGLALRVTINLKQGVQPWQASRDIAPGARVDFSDTTGNLVSGVVIANATTREGVLSSRPGDGPGTPQNTGELPSEFITPGPTTYNVYRKNAVSFAVTGMAVDADYSAVSADVSCGSFIYNG